MNTTIWITEDSFGTSIQFDTEPSDSDIRNCCEGMQHPIKVYAVEYKEVERELVSIIDDR